MALQLSWAVLLIGFAFGWISREPPRLGQRLARAAILGVVVAAALLLGGVVIGFVVPPTSTLLLIGNGAFLVFMFVVGVLAGEEVEKLQGVIADRQG